MDAARQKAEVDQNYDAFQRCLSSLLASHRDEYALMHNREIVDYFQDAHAAYRDGLRRFPDRIFSIQEVTDEPIDLGIFSHAGA